MRGKELRRGAFPLYFEPYKHNIPKQAPSLLPPQGKHTVHRLPSRCFSSGTSRCPSRRERGFICFAKINSATQYLRYWVTIKQMKNPSKRMGVARVICLFLFFLRNKQLSPPKPAFCLPPPASLPLEPLNPLAPLIQGKTRQ